MDKQNLHILLAEDDEDDSHFFQEAILSINKNYQLTIVSNGEKAINYFKESILMPDFIFLDINMPKVNGIECLKTLKSLHPSNDLNIVMLSTSVSHKMVESSYRHGASMYIQKPTCFNELVKYLDYCLHKLRNVSVRNGFVLNKEFKSEL